MKKKVLLIFTFLLLAVCLYTTAYAHSGRTDSNGGHYDRETGEYHYHHGYPAHDHDGGICPYNYDDRTGWNSGTTGDESKDNQSKGQKNIPKKTESNNSKLLPFILLLTPFAILLLFLLWSFIYGYVDSRKFAKEQAKYSQLMREKEYLKSSQFQTMRLLDQMACLKTEMLPLTGESILQCIARQQANEHTEKRLLKCAYCKKHS